MFEKIISLGTTLVDVLNKKARVGHGMMGVITLTAGGTTSTPADVKYNRMIAPTNEGATISAMTNLNSATPNALEGETISAGSDIDGVFQNVTITNGCLMLYYEHLTIVPHNPCPEYIEHSVVYNGLYPKVSNISVLKDTGNKVIYNGVAGVFSVASTMHNTDNKVIYNGVSGNASLI